MTTRPFAATLAILLTFTFVVPTAFFVAPPRAHAIWGLGDVVWDPGNYVPNYGDMATNVITTAKSILIEMHTYTSAMAEYAGYINTYILQPMAFILSGNLMKALTASVVQFVIGKANGTGVPQFVVDVRKSMQTVSDGAALAYLKQIKNTNSPFAGSIAQALNTDYLTGSSLKGFWDANMCTLAQSSPTWAPDYLNGSWSHGGVAAWFALTTQTQNNPYMLYQATQSKLASVIGPGAGGATGARASELNWGQGFMSWCGPNDTTVGVASGTGVNPGDPCTDKDGNPGIIKTPGSVILATLNKVLGGQQDEIVRMGNIGPEINGILSDVGKVAQTVMFASNILGGVGGNSGGLLGAGDTSASNPTSRLAQFTPTQDASGNFTSGYLGATNEHVQASAGSSTVSSSVQNDVITDMDSRIKKYQDGWNIIAAAANTASTSVASLQNVCTTNADLAKKDLLAGSGNAVILQRFIDASTAQATAAQVALASEIAPVLSQANNVPSIIAAAQAMERKVKDDYTTGSSSASADAETLRAMAPTGDEATSAQQNATTPISSVGASAATLATMATPHGSLTVPTSSLITVADQMYVISSNATTLQATVCNPASSLYGITL